MKKKQPKQAFTLIELLTVIAIIGILASILIPTVGKVREQARRTVDGNNIRQIGQGSLIYANDNREQLPQSNLNADGVPEGSAGSTRVLSYAAALAQSGGINDGNIWISTSDSQGNIRRYDGSPILNNLVGTNGYKTIRTTGDLAFGQLDALSFGVVSGLSTSSSSRTPIAFTRGLFPNGRWDSNFGVYGTNGGHIVYIGGNVSWYRDAGTAPAEGIFTDPLATGNNSSTNNIVNAVPAGTYIHSWPAAGPIGVNLGPRS